MLLVGMPLCTAEMHVGDGSGHIGDDREVRLEQPPLGAHMLVRLAALVAQRVEDAAETALKKILIHVLEQVRDQAHGVGLELAAHRAPETGRLAVMDVRQGGVLGLALRFIDV